jgi:hypothetical protein
MHCGTGLTPIAIRLFAYRSYNRLSALTLPADTIDLR